MIGETISHYLIVERVGQGGMGVVYKAKDTRLNRFVALKFLPEDLAQDAENIARFRREALASSALNHPNICAIHDIGEQDGRAFLVMEFLDGITLSEAISSKPLEIQQALSYAVELAEALSAAHAAGVIHRDIKPKNILITAGGHVKVLDFGVAKMIDASGNPFDQTTMDAALTSPGSTVGTIAYMSPEQARARELDSRTDLFSFGSVLYEMLTGCQAFRGRTNAEVFQAVLSSTPVPPVRLNPDLPRELEDIVDKSLEKDRDLRYQHASDIVADLKRVQRQLASSPAIQPQDRVSTSRPRLGAALAALAGVVVIALLFGVWQLRRNRPTSPATRPMLAVLPFQNLSGDPHEEYFADGLTEEMISQLGQLEPTKLGVIARTSTARYKGTTEAAQQIGHELGVGYLLEGSVRRGGGRIRVTATLVDASKQDRLWSESYERPLTDVLDIQREIAEKITQSLYITLIPGNKRLAASGPVNVESYDKYLLAMHELGQGTRESETTALRYLQEAIAASPQDARLYVGLAETYFALRTYYVSPSEVMPQAKEAALKALQLDPNLASAHAALGDIYMLYDWNWKAAESEFLRALDLNPNLPEAQLSYSDYLATLGRFDEALSHIRTAYLLDPLATDSRAEALWTYYYSGKLQETVDQAKKTVELEPQAALPYAMLALAYADLGNRTEAIRAADMVASRTDSPSVLGTAGSAYARAGETNKARKLLEDSLEMGKHRYVCRFIVAALYVDLHENEKAYESLERGYREKST